MLFAFQVIVGTRHSQSVSEDRWFLFCHNTDAVVDTETDEVIFLHHSAGKNTGFDLLSFSIGNSETDSRIFMFAAHGNAPFIFGVAAAVI